MIADDLYKKIAHKPDIVLGAHVSPHPAGTMHTRPGLFMSGANSLKVTINSRGGHSSAPRLTVDPVVMAGHILVRLRTIVSREVKPSEPVVVSIGRIEARQKDNIIPITATIEINIRTQTRIIRDRIMASVERIIRVDCEASGATAPPTVEYLDSLPLSYNNVAATTSVQSTFSKIFGQKFDGECQASLASEDFSILASEIEVPSCYWFYGTLGPAYII
jgi:amidohydrolase